MDTIRFGNNPIAINDLCYLPVYCYNIPFAMIVKTSVTVNKGMWFDEAKKLLCFNHNR